MNLEQEFAAIDRRIQRQINARAREALIRIGVDPNEVEREEQLAPYVRVGAAIREFVDVWVARFSAYDRGFQRQADVLLLSETDGDDA